MTAPVTELARLNAIADYAVVGAAPDDPVIAALTDLCELAVRVTDFAHAVVNIIDERFQHQVAAFGVDPMVCARADSMCAITLAHGDDTFVADASLDSRYGSSPWVDGRLGSVRAYCGVILHNPDGFALGTLCVFDEQPRPLELRQMRALQLLAQQVVDQFELRLRTRDLERSNAALAVSQDRLAAFAGQISHDLKAPITAILGFSELLGEIDAVAEDDTARGYVDRCSSSARRMRAMIDDLLAFAKVGGSITTSTVPLDEVVPEVLDDLRPLPTEAEVQWSGPPLTGDRQQLRALLQNLVGNALKYRRPDVAPRVDVHTASLPQGLLLTVTDNGCGIAPAHREEVLRPLVRLRRDVSGAGLGLAVSARIAAAHGGKLTISDGPEGADHGVTMSVLFPPPQPAD